MSAEDYVRTEDWKFIVVVRCPIHPDSDCRITRHGSYPRKIPDGATILRILCHTGNITFNLLPEGIAERRIQSLEKEVAKLGKHMDRLQQFLVEILSKRSAWHGKFGKTDG